MKKGSHESAKLIKDFLRGGLTVTVGGVPILITVGTEAATHAPARTAARKAAAVAPKPRRKTRRRRSRTVTAPDPRDIRGFLATQMEGSTLTALASHFHVKRPLMKRMLKRMLDKKEITLFKGAFFNSKRLRQRRIESKWSAQAEAALRAATHPEAVATPVVPLAETVEAPTPTPEPEPPPMQPVAEAQPEPTRPTAVPDPEPEDVEPLEYPERNAA